MNTPQNPARASATPQLLVPILLLLVAGPAAAERLCGARAQAEDGARVVAGDILSSASAAGLSDCAWAWQPADAAEVPVGPAQVEDRRLRSPPWPAHLSPGAGEVLLRCQWWGLDLASGRWPAQILPDPALDPQVVAVRVARSARDGNKTQHLLEVALTSAADSPLRAATLRVEAARQITDTSGLAAGALAWAQNAEVATLAGLPSEAARAWFAAAYMYLQSNALAEATAATAAGAALAERWSLCGGAATAARYSGLLASRLGHLRGAEPEFERAERLAAAEGQADLVGYARLNRAQLYTVQGRHAEALALLASVPEGPGFAGAARTVNLAWAALSAHASGALRAPLDALAQQLAGAAEAYAQLGQPTRAANAWINVAYARWLDETPAAATAALERAAALSPPRADYDGLFARLLRAQISLDASNLPEAGALFLAVAEDANARQSAEPAWRAHLGLARVAVAEDRPLAALDALDSASAWVESRARHAHLGEGQAGFVDERRDLHDLRMALLLGRADLAGAFAAEATWQARVLRALEAEVRMDRLSPEQRGRWTAKVAEWLQARARFEAAADDGALLGDGARARFLAARKVEAAALTARFDAAYAVLDEGAPLAAMPEDLDLATLRARLGPRGALVLFAAQPTGLGRFWLDAHTLRVSPVADSQTLPGLLGADLAALAGVDVLWVVSGGLPAAEALSSARLPDGTPLLSRCQVRILPTLSALLGRGAEAPAGPPVVVADPQSNLPAARGEGTQAANTDPQSIVFTGESAQHAAVLAALHQARWLHFAGHGVLSPERPWDAHLALAGGQRLTLADLMVARPRLGTVVLSGCDTGRALHLSDQAAVGLPAAFVSAGANAVLATTRPIGDGEPAAVLARFWAAGGATRPAAAWREAALASEAAGDRAWTAFTLIGPGE